MPIVTKIGGKKTLCKTVHLRHTNNVTKPLKSKCSSQSSARQLLSALTGCYVEMLLAGANNVLSKLYRYFDISNVSSSGKTFGVYMINLCCQPVIEIYQQLA